MRTLHIARAAGICNVVLIVVLSLLPGSERPHTGLLGEGEHFIAYILTAGLLALGFQSLAQRVSIVLGLALLAGLLEILQLWVPGRSSQVFDAAVGGFGALCGVLLTFAVDWRFPEKSFGSLYTNATGHPRPHGRTTAACDGQDQT